MQRHLLSEQHCPGVLVIQAEKEGMDETNVTQLQTTVDQTIASLADIACLALAACARDLTWRLLIVCFWELVNSQYKTAINNTCPRTRTTMSSLYAS